MPFRQFGANWSTSLFLGAELAVNEINSSGGINGQMLQLIPKDSLASGDVAKSAAMELVNQGVIAIMPLISTDTLGASDITISANIPLISPGSSVPSISSLNDNDTVWRTFASDAFAGVILSNTISKDAVGNISVIHRGDSFSAGLADSVVANFVNEASNRTLLKRVQYSEDKVLDFSNELDQLFSQGVPAGIVIIGFSADVANLTHELEAFQQAKSISPQPRYYFGFLDVALLKEGAHTILRGAKSVEFTSDETTTSFQTLSQNLANQFGTEQAKALLGFVRLTYDPIYLFALAMLQGKENTSQTIINNLRVISGKGASNDAVVIHVGEIDKAKQVIAAGGTVDYDGAIGGIEFDANGDIGFALFEVLVAQENTDGNLESVKIEVVNIRDIGK